MHHRHVLLLDFANLAERDVVRKTGQMIAMRHQMLESGARGARQEEKQTGGDHQNGERNGQHHADQSRRHASAGDPGGRISALAGLANLAARKRRHAEHQEEQQEHEKIEARRNNAGGQQFKKSDHLQKQVIAVGVGGQDLHHRHEEHQVDRGRNKRSRNQEIVDRRKRQCRPAVSRVTTMGGSSKWIRPATINVRVSRAAAVMTMVGASR